MQVDITHRTSVPDGELQVRTYPAPGGDMGPWADIELDADRRSYLSLTSLADADRLLKAVTLARAHLAAAEGDAS
jgi:hypothetical protein